VKLIDCPASARPNLHHVHDDGYLGAHTHDIVDHLDRAIEAVTHTHDPDGCVTVDGGRHKPRKA